MRLTFRTIACALSLMAGAAQAQTAPPADSTAPVVAPAPAAEIAPAPVAAPAPAPVPAPVAVPAIPAPPSGPGGLVCVPGARMFVFDDGAWYPATARDATVTTKLCLVRFDGYGEEEDKAISLNIAVPWSFDGPGRPGDACMAGERVVGLSDGAWHPATVVKASSSGCLLRFDDSEVKSDTLPFRSVRRVP